MVVTRVSEHVASGLDRDSAARSDRVETKTPRVRRPARRFRTLPTKGGIVVGSAGAMALLIGSNVSSGWLILLASVFLAAPAVSIVRSVVGVTGLALERDPITRGEAGSPLTYPLRVTAVRGPRSDLVVTDPVVGSSPGVVFSLPGHSSVVGEMRAIPERRGYLIDPYVSVECSAPLGLWSTSRRLPCPGAIEIAPAMPPVSVPWRAGGDDPLSEGLTDPPRRGVGLDFLGLREFRTGDTLRHIDWTSSARRDELVVREYQQEGVRPLVVMPDLSGDDPATERSISIAGSLVRDAVSRSIPVWLTLPGAETLVLDSPPLSALRSALARASTGVDARAGDAALSDPRLPRSPLVVLVAPPGGKMIDCLVRIAAQKRLILIGGAHDIAGRRLAGLPTLLCPLEGDACLTDLSAHSAA